MRHGTVAIIGVGLIGGSVGCALRARGLAGRVVGVGRDSARLERAREMGAIHSFELDTGRGVREAEVVVVCTPVSRIVDDVRVAAASMPEDGLITDAGSTKAGIVGAIESVTSARARFIGAHPIAGSEKSGVEHASEDLFERATCVLTPTPRSDPGRLESAARFWSALGCGIRIMSPDEHDAALAKTSHMPHAVASALARFVAPESFDLAAGAFRDTTRVAAADAALWSSIFVENRGPLLDSLEQLEAALAELRSGLRDRDLAAIEAWCEIGCRARREYDRARAVAPRAESGKPPA